MHHVSPITTPLLHKIQESQIFKLWDVTMISIQCQVKLIIPCNIAKRVSPVWS